MSALVAAAKPCVFLDRDGTLIEDPGYVHRSEDLRFLPGVAGALARLKRAGYLLVVVTNQAGVARGLYAEGAVHALHARINAELGTSAAIDAFYHCPYHPAAIVAEYRRSSELRKPEIGMFRKACEEHAIVPSQSYMVGDRLTDIEFGRRAGLSAILVRSGHSSREESMHAGDRDFVVVEDFPQAAEQILAAQTRTQLGGMPPRTSHS